MKQLPAREFGRPILEKYAHSETYFGMYDTLEQSEQMVSAIAAWLPGGTTEYFTRRDVQAQRRWEFVGRLAPRAIRDKYLHMDVAGYYTKSSSLCVYAPVRSDPLWVESPVRVPLWQ